MSSTVVASRFAMMSSSHSHEAPLPPTRIASTRGFSGQPSSNTVGVDIPPLTPRRSQPRADSRRTIDISKDDDEQSLAESMISTESQALRKLIAAGDELFEELGRQEEKEETETISTASDFDPSRTPPGRVQRRILRESDAKVQAVRASLASPKPRTHSPKRNSHHTKSSTAEDDGSFLGPPSLHSLQLKDLERQYRPSRISSQMMDVSQSIREDYTFTDSRFQMSDMLQNLPSLNNSAMEPPRQPARRMTAQSLADIDDLSIGTSTIATSSLENSALDAPASLTASSSANEPIMLEVGPGDFLPLRGSKETWQCIQDGSVTVTMCVACNIELHCIDDAKLVVCPDCCMLSPVDQTDSSIHSAVQRHGVGVGIKSEDVVKWVMSNS